ncbi:MAG: HAD-IIB family hydrolase [Clostridia bacterium]|nr:HAD-IIB family hydrolase [Clostridia bacterium]
MIKYLFFDLDGTLTDPFEGITRCVEYALDRYGIAVDDRRTLAPFIGPPLADSFIKYYGFTREKAFEAIDVYRERFRDIGLFENEVYAGVPEMLDTLKKSGAKIVLATSKPRVFAERILDHFSLTKYFDFIDGSELDGSRVRKDEVIAHALECLGCNKSEVVMIGDRMHDIEGAKKNGLISIGVLWGYGPREELTDAGADMIAETIGELTDILSGLTDKKAKTLYISDLDGTLLSPKAELTDLAKRAINDFCASGGHFSIATARTAATVEGIFAGVKINDPCILMNGVCSYDLSERRYTEINYIPIEAVTSILEVVKKYNISGFLYTIKDGELSTFYENTDSPGAAEFIEERIRKYNKPFTKIDSFFDYADQGCIYFSVSDKHEKLADAKNEIALIDGIHIEFYRDIYNTDCWYMEICSNKASKSHALKHLMSDRGYDRAVGFGDNLNDLPLFECCDIKYAVANARDEVKAAADHIIGSNAEDAVAKLLISITGKEL